MPSKSFKSVEQIHYDQNYQLLFYIVSYRFKTLLTKVILLWYKNKCNSNFQHKFCIQTRMKISISSELHKYKKNIIEMVFGKFNQGIFTRKF